MTRAALALAAVVGYVATTRWLDYHLTRRALRDHERDVLGPDPRLG